METSSGVVGQGPGQVTEFVAGRAGGVSEGGGNAGGEVVGQEYRHVIIESPDVRIGDLPEGRGGPGTSSRRIGAGLQASSTPRPQESSEGFVKFKNISVDVSAHPRAW